MREQPQTERWHDNRREDGLTVVEGIEGWMIMPTEGGPTMTVCPCCDKAFQNARAARLVADLVYPIGRQ